MRLIFGLVTAGFLAALSQPALAVCINRGGISTCVDEPKYWKPTPLLATGSPDAAPDPSLKAIVLQPSASSGNAWVDVPKAGDGAAASGGGTAAAPACILGANC